LAALKTRLAETRRSIAPEEDEEDEEDSTDFLSIEDGGALRDHNMTGDKPLYRSCHAEHDYVQVIDELMKHAIHLEYITVTDEPKTHRHLAALRKRIATQLLGQTSVYYQVLTKDVRDVIVYVGMDIGQDRMHDKFRILANVCHALIHDRRVLLREYVHLRNHGSSYDSWTKTTMRFLVFVVNVLSVVLSD